MIERKHLAKLKKIFNISGDGINLTQSLLCAVALGEKLPPSLYKNNKTRQVFNGLRRYKFVRHITRENGNLYSITPKGENKLQNILIDKVVIKNHKNWDGKWYLVIYDFPIRFKKAREAFRWKLKDLGFLQLQKSAWIYPYPCEREILFVADFHGVRKHIEILQISKMLDNKKLKEHFNL